MLMLRGTIVGLSLLLAACTVEGADNDCLIQAVRAQAELPKTVWSRLLFVRYQDCELGHVYAVYELTGHRVFVYDRTFGSRRINPRSLKSCDVVQAADGRANLGYYMEDTPVGASIKH